MPLEEDHRPWGYYQVLAGRAIVTRDDQEFELGAGQATDIPRGALHRVRNPGSENTAFIEIQTGDYFGEDDIGRV